MRIITDSKNLPEFPLPIRIEDAADLDLRDFLAPKDSKEQRNLLKRMARGIANLPDKLEAIVARQLVKRFQKYTPDFEYSSDFAKTKEFESLVDYLQDYFYKEVEKDLEKLEPDSSISDSLVEFRMQQMVVKSKALLNTLDKMFFEPGKKNDPLSFSLRRLFIHANNQARDELITGIGVVTPDGDPHDSLSMFESMTQLTPHYNLGLVDSHGKHLKAFMPVSTQELDWQNEYLDVLKKLFDLSDEKLKSVRYLGLFNEPGVEVEGFARTKSVKPYVHVAPDIIDKAIVPELKDPEAHLIPMSTAVHEITHGLLKERYPEFFNPMAGDQLKEKPENIKINVQTSSGIQQFPVKDIEELICFALTIYINPVTTIRKLASIKADDIAINDNYALAALYGRSLHAQYKLSDSLQYTANHLEQVKSNAFEIAKDYLGILDNLRAEYLK